MNFEYCNTDAVLFSEAIEIAAKLMDSLDYEQNGDDVLVAQTKAFLQSNLSMYVLPFRFEAYLTFYPCADLL